MKQHEMERLARIGAAARLENIRGEIADLERWLKVPAGTALRKPRLAQRRRQDRQVQVTTIRKRKPMTARQKRVLSAFKKKWWADKRKAERAA